MLDLDTVSEANLAWRFNAMTPEAFKCLRDLAIRKQDGNLNSFIAWQYFLYLRVVSRLEVSAVQLSTALVRKNTSFAINGCTEYVGRTGH